MPAVVICTEQFNVLAKTVMRAQNVPESIGIHIGRNPEFISDEDLMKVADRVVLEVIARLSGKQHA